MTAPSDFAADNSYAHGDGTDDPDLHDAGEHPALPVPLPRTPTTTTTAAVSHIAGICTEHEMSWQQTAHWTVCMCTDGQHAGNPILDRIPADDEAMARRIAAAGYGRHAVRQYHGQYVTRAEVA